MLWPCTSLRGIAVVILADESIHGRIKPRALPAPHARSLRVSLPNHSRSAPRRDRLHDIAPARTPPSGSSTLATHTRRR